MYIPRGGLQAYESASYYSEMYFISIPTSYPYPPFSEQHRNKCSVTLQHFGWSVSVVLASSLLLISSCNLTKDVKSMLKIQCSTKRIVRLCIWCYIVVSLLRFLCILFVSNANADGLLHCCDTSINTHTVIHFKCNHGAQGCACFVHTNQKCRVNTMQIFFFFLYWI